MSALASIHVGAGLLDFLRPRTVLLLGKFGLQVGELASLLGDLRAVLVIFQANQRLAGLHLIALVDTDPGDSAIHLRSDFNLMGRDNVAGSRQDHLLAGRGNAHRRLHLSALRLAWQR